MAFADKIQGALRIPAAVSQITSRDLLNVCFYYRRVALAIFGTITLLSIIAAILMPPAYTAEARLLTLYARDYQVQSDDPDTRATLAFDHTQINDVEAEILASRELHRAVVTAGMDGVIDPIQLDRRLDRFERQFRIEKIDGANVIHLSFVDSDPQRAADTLNSLISFYFAQRAGVFTSGREAFLTQQRDRVKTDLDAANARIVAFQQQHGIANIEDQIAAAVTLDNQTLEKKLGLIQSIAQDEAALRELLAQFGGVPSEIPLYSDDIEEQALDSLQQTLIQLESRRADLASRYVVSSHYVVQLDDQIKGVKAAIDNRKPHQLETTRIGRNTSYDTLKDRIIQLRATLAGERAQQAEVSMQLSAIETGLNGLIGVSNQLKQMGIDRDLLVDSFRNFMRQLEQARIAENQDRTVSNANVRIIQAPYPPARRSNSPLMFVAAGIFAGLLVAGVTIVVLSSLRQFFLSPEEVERSLGLPVLTAPFVREPTATASLPPGRNRKSDYARLVGALGTATESAGKVALLISPHAGDGVGQILQGLALDLESRSVRPIFILDLFSTAGSPLGVPDETGEISWQARTGISRIPISDDTLPPQAGIALHRVAGHAVVIGRPSADHPSSMSGLNRDLIDRLRAAHDFVLIHSPSADLSSIGIEYAALADATLMVIKAESTRKPVALALMEQITEAEGRIIGFALTNRRSYIPRYLYP